MVQKDELVSQLRRAKYVDVADAYGLSCGRVALIWTGLALLVAAQV